ncbi:putative mitochondrial protein AtMg00310 [Apium graveolens]|uniref:putative mitochondrial protein AtMg00310 n=1 Tax=Apium graveolens TaxID=4045 RepID=UPI003D7B00E3
MSVFLLPTDVCKELEMAVSMFWWKSDSSKDKSIHWMCWSRLIDANYKGGMGFRNLREFNVALLGNQACRLISYPDKLVSRILKARYYPTLKYGPILVTSGGASWRLKTW